MKSVHNNNSISEERTRGMTAIQLRIAKEAETIRGMLYAFKISTEDDIADYVLHLLERRLTKKPLRAYYVFRIYEYCQFILREKRTSTPKFFETQLPLIIEIIIVIQYLHNQILDNKFNNNQDKGVSQKLLSANLLKDVLYEYISIRTPKNYQERIIHHVRKIFQYVDIGQRIDKEGNNYKSYKENGVFIPNPSHELSQNIHWGPAKEIISSLRNTYRSKANYLELYFYRIYLTNSFLFVKMTDLICNLLNYPLKLRYSLYYFATNYSIALQIVNDNADFVPSLAGMETVGKDSSDTFKDLENQTISLPLFLHLESGRKGLVVKYLENKKSYIINRYKVEILKEMIASGSIRKSRQIGKRFSDIAVSELDQNNPHYADLVNMAGIARWNKYYYEIQKIEKGKSHF